MKKIKISELPLYQSLKGLFVMGTDVNNRSVKVNLEFIESETRYSRLQRAFPERAQVLFDKAADAAKDRYEYLGKLAKLYE